MCIRDRIPSNDTIVVEDTVDTTLDGSSDTGVTEPTPVTPDPVVSIPSTPDSAALISTRVEFDITVPAYQSNALQVRLQWGDKDISAAFVVDESWSVVDDFPVDTENTLTVTFNDDNGGITLGSFEQAFTTGSSESETFEIAAAQFDTNRWDSDGDGVSNLDELIAGANPLGDDPLTSVQASLELVPDKIFRFSWLPSTGADFYRVLENPDGVSGFSDVSGDIDANTLQFDHRVALHKRMSASYIVQACNEQSCVDSDEMLVPESIAQALVYFKANDAEERDGFGVDLVLSPDGNTMAVTRPGSSEFTSTRDERVYVFARVDNVWQQQAILDGTEPVSVRDFGQALSLSGNGDLLAVGSPEEILRNEDGDTEERAGAVYVYQRASGRWQQQARLVSSTISSSDQFGFSVSLSADGNTLAVGAPGVGDGVFVYELIDGSWQQERRVIPDISDNAFGFGGSVSLSEDGNTLAVGSDRFVVTGDPILRRAGAAYIFSRVDTDWEQRAFLLPDDPVEGAFFGRSISLDADGDVLAVGAPLWNFGRGESGPPIGTAYVFRNVSGIWQQEARLNTTFQGDITGSEVDLSGDGSTLAVTSFGRSFVTIYKNEGVNWLLQARFNGNSTQLQNEADLGLDSIGRPISPSTESFASSLSLSSDGETLAIGAAGENGAAREINGDRNDNSRSNSGAVFLY